MYVVGATLATVIVFFAKRHHRLSDADPRHVSSVGLHAYPKRGR